MHGYFETQAQALLLHLKTEKKKSVIILGTALIIQI